MKKFIVLLCGNCEKCFNLDHIISFKPVSSGKFTKLTLSNISSVIVNESYETVKAKILKGESPKEI